MVSVRMRWRFLWRRVVIGPRRPALCRHHPEPRGGGGGGGHAEVVPGSTLLQRRRAAPGLRAPLQLLRVGVRGWGGCVLLCVGPVGPLRCSGPLLGGGRCPVPPTQGISLPSPPSPPLAPLESPQTFPVLSSDPQGNSAPPSPKSSSPILIPGVLFHPAPQCLPSVPLHPFSILHQVPCLPPPVPYSNSQCPLSPLPPPLLSL